MKKLFTLTALLAMFISAEAQIVGSTSKQIQTTYTTTTRTVSEEYDHYNRLQWNFATTHFNPQADLDFVSSNMYGVGMGWLKGINLTGKKIPLYLELGVSMKLGFGGNSDSEWFLWNFEIPLNVSYRIHFGSSKVKIAPYWGIHNKVNALYIDDDGDSRFDEDYYIGFKRFQIGTQLGVNFDFNHFNLGFEWGADFMPIRKLEGYTTSGYYHYDTYKLKTSGIRLNIGVVW